MSQIIPSESGSMYNIILYIDTYDIIIIIIMIKIYNKIFYKTHLLLPIWDILN